MWVVYQLRAARYVGTFRSFELALHVARGNAYNRREMYCLRRAS